VQSESFEGRAIGERPTLVAPDPSTGFGGGERTTADRVRSTLRRAGTHLVNTVGDLVGDDVAGRLVRRGVVRIAGAEIPRSTHLLGGTYFSRAGNLNTGERCLINRGCYLDLHAPITLGDDVVIGHGTSIITSRHFLGPATRRAGSVEGLPVLVGSGAWLGANVTVLPGVTIGPGAVVAAGAVVNSDVPANAVVAGVPARVIRRLDHANEVQAGA
jgi:maltose O-acetyltransferase